MKIGEGNYAKVFKVESESGQVLAKKVFETQEQYLKEIGILVVLQHENIITQFGSAVINDKNVIFLEFCEYNMREYVRIFNILNKDAVNFGKQIARGIKYLHSRQILHRDIKPENILFSVKSATCKICDFNLATRLAEPDFEASGITGSPLYCAPEVIRGKKYSYPADIWSFGVTIFYIRTGKDIFKSNSVYDLSAEHKRGNYKIPSYIGDFSAFLLAAICYSPRQRRDISYFIDYEDK